jgi:hypothetical protein
MSLASQSQKRTVTAPPPSPPSAQPLPNQVFSVVLNDDEDVEWLWTCSMDRVSYVSGYRVVRKKEESIR